MTNKTLTKYKRSLRPFAELYAEIVTQIEAASDRQLSHWLKCCGSLTNSNCWWATYQVAQIMPDLIQKEQSHRKYLKDKKRKEGKPHPAQATTTPTT